MAKQIIQGLVLISDHHLILILCSPDYLHRQDLLYITFSSVPSGYLPAVKLPDGLQGAIQPRSGLLKILKECFLFLFLRWLFIHWAGVFIKN